MTNTERWSLVAAAAGAALFATTASAQPAPAAAATTSANDASRIVTPRKSEAVARARAVFAQKLPGKIDWQAVRARIEATRTRDAEYDRRAAAGANRTVAAAPPPRPGGLERLDPARLQSRFATAARARATFVPLLVPTAPEFVGTLKIFPRPDSYAATARLADGAEIDVLGTRMRVVGGAPEALKARAVARERASRRLADLDAPYVVSKHEEGLDLSFSLFNAAYLVSVRCPDPEADVRCTDESYAAGLARRMGLLNDEPAGDGQ